MATNELTKIENKIDSLIEMGDTAWRKIAELLTTVRDDKLYLEAGHKTFEKYIHSRWGKSRNWAYGLMKSNLAVKQLTQKDVTHALQKEMTPRAAEQLSKVPEENREEVIKAIIDAKQPVNSSTIKKAAAVVVATKDNDGNDIPDYALQYWNRRQEVQDVLTVLSKLRTQLEARVEAGDKMWCMDGVSQRLQTELKALYENAKNLLPYAVCVVCEGHVASGSCDACHDTGLVSQVHYQNFSDKRLIEIRRKKHGNNSASVSASRL